VLIASGTTLILKEGDVGVVMPAIGVASIMMGALVAMQIVSHSRSNGRKRPAPSPS
jgi:hypothetical protein